MELSKSTRRSVCMVCSHPQELDTSKNLNKMLVFAYVLLVQPAATPLTMFYLSSRAGRPAWQVPYCSELLEDVDDIDGFPARQLSPSGAPRGVKWEGLEAKVTLKVTCR